MKAPAPIDQKARPEHSVKVLLKPISRTSTPPPRRPPGETRREWLARLRRLVTWTGRWE